VIGSPKAVCVELIVAAGGRFSITGSWEVTLQVTCPTMGCLDLLLETSIVLRVFAQGVEGKGEVVYHACIPREYHERIKGEGNG
jgi:hypothetical protein